MKKELIIIMAVSAMLLTTLGGCEIFNPPVLSGQIEFVDYKDQEGKIIAGNEGLMAFGEKLVEMGDRAILPLAIKNTGEGPLLITNMHVKADVFGFVEESFPDLPLSIPSGKTVNDIFLEFAPVAAGEFTGKVFIDTELGSYYLDMSGTGLWQLTLTGNDDGKIILPIEVDGVAETKTITTSTGIFYLSCETELLREFGTWREAGAPNPVALAPIFDNAKAKKTEVELRYHTHLTVDIENPYIYVPNDFANIQTAIDTCAADNTKFAVVVAAGTHNFTGDIIMKNGVFDSGSGNEVVRVPLYGGYDAGWSARSYKTAAERAVGTYETIINITGSISASGSALNNKVVIEGFTITKQAGGNDNALVVFNNSTTAGLLHNTITSSGSGSSVGVLCTNSAEPLIRYNYINGGTSSADYSESYGIQVTEGGKPVIYKNSIAGGAANGTGSKSFGIFCDFEAEPIIMNNTPMGPDSYGISGGTGAESYGIYIINNGKVIAKYNDINGGSGTTSRALFANYGGYFKLDSNNIHTSSGTTRKGVETGMSGRVYSFINNGVYDCPDALLEEYFGGAITSIDDLNDKFHVESNQAEAVDLSAAPSEVQYE